MSGNTALREQRIAEAAQALWVAAGSPAGGADAYRAEARAQIAQEERALDETGAESFPASDPPANTGITGPERA